MRVEEEEEKEEEKILEGICDRCMEYRYNLTECPEHCHEVKRDRLFDDKLCTECCKEYLDEKECYMSCGESFIEQYFIEKFGHRCEEFGLIKSDKLNGYTNADETLLVIFNKHIHFKSKQDVKIDQPLIVNENCIVKYENKIYNYKTKDYSFLYDLFENEFEEYFSFSLLFNESTDEDTGALLKIRGDMVSGFLLPDNFDFFKTQDEFESRIKKSFIEDMLKGIDILGIGNNIKKYCTIPQGYCHRHIKYQGKDSYFIAYPFTPNKYPRFVSRLKSKLEDKGMKVILPIEEYDHFPNTGILFCKLCEMILSTNSIICEATEINQNVMFEAGYAIGLGKYCHFIIDGSYDKNKRHELDLIRDQLTVYYTDEDECAKDFTLKEENISHYLPIRPPQFENKYAVESKSNKNRILLLVPEEAKYQKIEAEIKNHLNSKYEFSNTKIITGHELINCYKNIKDSEFVIGILLSDTYEQKELKNSRISFLLGLSLALGKKTIIFQEIPAKKKIIDFKNLSREFIDKEDLLNSITTFFNGEDAHNLVNN
ncbi:hypothetical protein HNV12_22365 [Methanococcoides sp. SA1]|nr:hypothetical protein [Methanococcoides sp. SA1]